jgi:putative hydrolase of HD superfamily
MKRLQQQIQFILETDKLKQIVRRTLLTDASRLENAAEHSWQITVMALVLKEYAPDKDLDLLRIVKMLLIHDLVEIDTGDVHFCDTNQRVRQKEREIQAADRIFNLLPKEQARSFIQLWNEFETRKSPEARFAQVLDRLQPLLHGYITAGQTWKKHGINRHHLLSIIGPMKEAAPEIYDYAAMLIADAIDKGFLP